MRYDKELLDDFVSESRELLAAAERGLRLLEAGGDDVDMRVATDTCRAFHTIKGTSGFFAMMNMNRLAKSMEALLAMIKSGKALPDQAGIALLCEGVAVLNSMLDDVGCSNEVDIDSVCGRLSALTATLETGREE